MFKLIVLAVLAAHTFASPGPYSGRVVNGTNAAVGEIPYIVSVRSPIHNCGGSILDERHILTAAHCVDGELPYAFTVQYGVTKISREGNVIQVVKSAIHEDFDSGNGYLVNDVAVLTLGSPIIYSDAAQPVVLPEQDEAPPEGGTAVLAGWGSAYTGGGSLKNLQRVDVLVYSYEDCRKAYGSQVNPLAHVCSGIPEGGKGPCSGDSGGPLIADGKQIGTVSWSLVPCTTPGYPAVYGRISTYVDWINKQRQ